VLVRNKLGPVRIGLAVHAVLVAPHRRPAPHVPDKQLRGTGQFKSMLFPTMPARQLLALAHDA
jgi:hypothetical protein